MELTQYVPERRPREAVSIDPENPLPGAGLGGGSDPLRPLGVVSGEALSELETKRAI